MPWFRLTFLILCCSLAAGQDRDKQRTEGKNAFDAEMARDKTGDCPNALTTLDSDICLARERELTDQNYKTYTAALRAILEPAEAAEFDNVERLWKSYADAACTAVYHSYGRGTLGPTASASCTQRLVRSHMRDLDSFYDSPLHH